VTGSLRLHRGWSGAPIVALLLVPPLSAQEVVFSASATVERDRATTDAAAILLPVGSQDDAAGHGGTAWLLGHTLASQANRALDGLGAEVTVSVERSTTRFTLTALPHVWPEAWARFKATVFTDPIDPEAFSQVFKKLSAQMAFREGSPVFDFERESASMLAPPSHEWARNPFGTSESRAAISVQHADLLRADLYHPATATVGFVGDNVGRFPAATSRPATATAPPAHFAWLVGDRIALTQEVTSAWISVAYPAPPSTGRTSLEFIAHLIRAALDPDPPDPERYSIDVRIVDAPGGPVIVVEAAVFPEAADRWEQGIVATIAAMAAGPPTGDFFQWERRRFRSLRLQEDATPQSAAARIVADLRREGVPRDLNQAISELAAETIGEVLNGLGETRVFRLGPDLGLGSGTEEASLGPAN